MAHLGEGRANPVLCKYFHTNPLQSVNIFTMSWLIELGIQIRSARLAVGMSQSALSAQTSVSREQISNIERGVSAPAVNIVAEIAAALSTSFEIRGIRIGLEKPGPIEMAPPPASQLSFPFGTEQRFRAASITVNSISEDMIFLEVRLTEREVA